MTYEEFCKSVSRDGDVLPKGITAYQALDILFEHFLPEGVDLNYPAGKQQVYTEKVAAILKKYPSGKWRKIPKKK